MCIFKFFSKKSNCKKGKKYEKKISKYLGKKVDTKNNSIEILPMMYEKLYIKESNSQLGKEYIEYLDSQITEKSDLKYRIAIEAQQDMLDLYSKEQDPDKLQIQSKKLTKKLTKKLAK